jgi:hypothetical protein
VTTKGLVLLYNDSLIIAKGYGNILEITLLPGCVDTISRFLKLIYEADNLLCLILNSYRVTTCIMRCCKEEVVDVIALLIIPSGCTTL